jgi:hypothetical protein
MVLRGRAYRHLQSELSAHSAGSFCQAAVRLLHYTFRCVSALRVTAAAESAVTRLSVLTHLPKSLEEIAMAAATNLVNEVVSTFQHGPAYRYIRRTDHLPTYVQLGDKGFDKIVARVRLFNPTGAGTWWIAAYDADSMIAWGVAEIHEREVGSFSLRELAEFRGRFGLPIERDVHYRPITVAALLEEER